MHIRRNVSSGILMLAPLFLIAGPVQAAGTVTITSITTNPFTEGLQFSGVVGAFSDTSGIAPANLTVTIDWGDGSGRTKADLVTQVGGPNGTTYIVSGTHTYTAEGAFTVTFTVTESANVANTDTGTQVADVEEGSQQFGAVQDQSFTGIAATFTDPSGSGMAPGAFTATIDWGDGKPTTAGVLAGRNGGPYSVTGTHTYATAGTFTATVTFAGAASGTITSTAIVSPFATASATDLTPTKGSSFSSQVATFVTSNTSTTAASYTATIDWGDGTTTSGSVTGVNPNFIVNGSHTYGHEATLAATVTITDGSAATAVVDKVTVAAGASVGCSSAAGGPAEVLGLSLTLLMLFLRRCRSG